MPDTAHSTALILGGSRSGKSLRAENLARLSGLPVVYVATYLTGTDDSEMRGRIARHRERRPPEWKCVENRLALAEIAAEHAGHAVLVDCLTLWISARQSENMAEDEILTELSATVKSAQQSPCSLIIVSNEVGLGLVPSSPEGRLFRDICGRANQLAASLSDRVEFMVAGIPMRLKPAQHI